MTRSSVVFWASEDVKGSQDFHVKHGAMEQDAIPLHFVSGARIEQREHVPRGAGIELEAPIKPLART